MDHILKTQEDWDRDQRAVRLFEQAVYRQALLQKERKLVRLQRLVAKLKKAVKFQKATISKDVSAGRLELEDTIGG